MIDKQITTLDELNETLSRITFAASCVDFNWAWESKFVSGEGEFSGWLIRTSFTRPDMVTGQVSRGFGRWEFVAKGTSESGVIKTAWLLVELIVRHELMEAFLVDGVRIFNPHYTITQLQMSNSDMTILGK